MRGSGQAARADADERRSCWERSAVPVRTCASLPRAERCRL